MTHFVFRLSKCIGSLIISMFLNIMMLQHVLQGMSSQGAPMRSSAGTHESNSVTIGVADEHIGAVVGRGGRNIMEITQVLVLMFSRLFYFDI